MVLKSQLNSRNKFIAINSLAVPVMIYSFSIINWTDAEIRKLDRKTRKLLTLHRSHHPKADVDRLYIPRLRGGRGLLQLEIMFKLTFIGVNCYLKNNKDWMMSCVKDFEKHKKLYSITSKAEKYKKELGYELPRSESPQTAVQAAKSEKVQAKAAAIKELLNKWQNKPLHGKFKERVSKADVDLEKTFM